MNALWWRREITVSDGIVKTADGPAVFIRDPDMGGFIELWEPAK